VSKNVFLTSDLIAIFGNHFQWAKTTEIKWSWKKYFTIKFLAVINEKICNYFYIIYNMFYFFYTFERLLQMKLFKFEE
jgi:hypothetical protein